MSSADDDDPAGRVSGPADLRQRMRKAFKASSLQLEAERLNRPRDWASLRTLVDGHRMRMWEANAVYKAEYKTRVEIRMREITDLRGKKTLDHKHPQGMFDKFSASDIRRQAERDVRHNHQKHIARLRRQREHDLRALMEKAQRKQAVQGKAKDGFNRATDRRTGEDRRDTGNQTRAHNRARTKPRNPSRSPTRGRG